MIVVTVGAVEASSGGDERVPPPLLVLPAYIADVPNVLIDDGVIKVGFEQYVGGMNSDVLVSEVIVAFAGTVTVTVLLLGWMTHTVDVSPGLREVHLVPLTVVYEVVWL